ncbi:MAG: hypothetical protein U0525_01955 [Patescibacteria group bacterium]
MLKQFGARHIALIAGLSALSAVTQLNHIGYQSPTWGMWIDFVAVFWIVAFFLYGLRMSLLVSFIGAIIIALFAPDTWLGALMKLIATLPLIFSLGGWLSVNKNSKIEKYKNILSLVAPLVIGILLRCLVVLPVNYYFALPIWTKMTTAQAWQAIPWYIIAGFNIVQSLIDILVAWILVYKFKLDRYANSSEKL